MTPKPRLKLDIGVTCQCERCDRLYQYTSSIVAKGETGQGDVAVGAAACKLDKKLDKLRAVSRENFNGLRYVKPEKCPACHHLQSWMLLYYRHLYTGVYIWVKVVAGVAALYLASLTNPITIAVVYVGVFIMARLLIHLVFSPHAKGKMKLPSLDIPSTIHISYPN